MIGVIGGETCGDAAAAIDAIERLVKGTLCC